MTAPVKEILLFVNTASTKRFLYTVCTFLYIDDTGITSDVLANLGIDLDHILSFSKKSSSPPSSIGALNADDWCSCSPAPLSRPFRTTWTVGQFAVGLGVGSVAMVILLYAGELAPARSCGQLIVHDNMCVAFLVANFVFH